MKKSTALIIVAFMLLTVFASIAIAADHNSVFAANNAVEVYGPVYNGSNLTDIIARQGSNYAITIDGNNFAAFNLGARRHSEKSPSSTCSGDGLNMAGGG
jgi:hypothetical protein